MEEPMSTLTHDLIAEILCRVPYKSLCICKCVCPAWRGIIADPAHRKKMAQTLAGFLYRITADSAEPRGHAVNYADLSAFPWASVAETYPLLPLPPDSTDCFVSLEDSCDGLFLTSIRTGTPAAAGTSRYMVSNPATGEYIVLPHSGYAGDCCRAYLGFDSGVSTQEFHLFEFVLEQSQSLVVRRVNIYSSKSGVWVSMKSQWDSEVSLCWGQPGVFHKGCLHLLIRQRGLAIVDAQGLRWRIIPLPISVDPSFAGFIGKSAGQLFYIDSDDTEGYDSNTFSTISVYVLGAEIYQWDGTHLDDKCMHWKLLRKLSNVAPNVMFQLGFDLEVIGVCLLLHVGQFGLAIVDAEGLRWRIIPLPVVESVNPCFSGFIGKSAGQLIYIDCGGIEGHGSNALSTISVYVLGAEICQWDVTHLDDKCMRWNFLHKLSNVAPKKMFRLGFDLEVVAVHPHANIIFFVAHWKNELVAYDLDRHETTTVYHIDPNYRQFMNFFPYVPLSSRVPLDGGIRLATPNQ
uniref:Uncharacterized protein n=1 Tax=Aegilops tauschii TaxID=37682 RepID=M8AHA1_AEGTA